MSLSRLSSKIEEAAKDALQDMPPRDEGELDQVTLHNLALINDMEDKPSEGFRKLNFLLQQHPSPPETFVNLLLLYCKYNYYDLAADILAENADLTYKYLQPQEYEFLDALILAQSAPGEGGGADFLFAIARDCCVVYDSFIFLFLDLDMIMY